MANLNNGTFGEVTISPINVLTLVDDTIVTNQMEIVPPFSFIGNPQTTSQTPVNNFFTLGLEVNSSEGVVTKLSPGLGNRVYKRSTNATQRYFHIDDYANFVRIHFDDNTVVAPYDIPHFNYNTNIMFVSNQTTNKTIPCSFDSIATVTVEGIPGTSSTLQSIPNSLYVCIRTNTSSIICYPLNTRFETLFEPNSLAGSGGIGTTPGLYLSTFDLIQGNGFSTEAYKRSFESNPPPTPDPDSFFIDRPGLWELEFTTKVRYTSTFALQLQIGIHVGTSLASAALIGEAYVSPGSSTTFRFLHQFPPGLNYIQFRYKQPPGIPTSSGFISPISLLAKYIMP